MADEADMANDMAELSLQMALRNVNSGPKLQPNGLCYYCESHVEGEKLFCDKDCADDYEKEQRLRKRR